MQSLAFKPSKEMTFATVQADCRRLHEFCRRLNDQIFNIDLSEVTHCDSAGLALLIEAKRIGKEQNKVCTFEQTPRAIVTLAKFCGVDIILDLAPEAI